MNTFEVAADFFRDYAFRVRIEWFPDTCPWVGAIDDEAARLERLASVWAGGDSDA